MVTSKNASGMPNKGRRIALVMGVNEVPNSSLPQLKHAVADAEAMAAVLLEYCGFELLMPPLLNENATSEKVKTAVLELAWDRTDEDFLLLYFSGHGQPMTIQADRRDVYLVTHNFREREVKQDENLHFSMRWLQDKLYLSTEAGRVLLILDCCYAGNIGRTAPDPYLEEIQERINYYFGAPGSDSGARSGALRLALTATGHNTKALEKDGHGLMTSLLLPALRGKVEEVLGNEGQVSLQRLLEYLHNKMPPEQQPALSGDDAGRGRSCILASHLKPALLLHDKPTLEADRPMNYIPYPRNPLFQPRPGEFEQLEHLLFEQGTERPSPCIGLVGMVGLGGVGKTQLAIQIAYRCLDKKRFPAGVFWMPSTGSNLFEWQRQVAELAAYTEYLPHDDDVSDPENEVRRARHFCRYLADHTDALLILDHVEDPSLVISALPVLAGGEVACTILYTSRKRFAPPGVMIHAVEQLPEEGALRLLLETTRPTLLAETLAGSQTAEANAARTVCQGVGYLPLALVHLRALLARDKQVTLVRLADVLRKRGAFDIAKAHEGDAAPLFATFWLSWEKVRDEGAQRLFKLASYFPEAVPIPLWLLGLAAGLGESGDVAEPLWEARVQLEELSLFEVLSEGHVRLHPLVRAFGRRLVAEDHPGAALLAEAGKRLADEFSDLNKLEGRAQSEGYWGCLEKVRAAREYAELLRAGAGEQLERVERWLARESYLLGDGKLWPEIIPGLFYQQLFNRSVEEGHPLPAGEAPTRWLKQIGQVGVEDRSLLMVFAGHAGEVRSVAFSPDGTKVLTGSSDGTARLWEMTSGKVLATLNGHSDWVTSVACSPNGEKIVTGSYDRTAQIWETASGKLLVSLEAHTDRVMSVAFSPNATKALTGSDDMTIRLWDTASGNLITTLEGHSGGVWSVRFSPDGTRLLTGSSDGTARLWNAESGKLLATLEGHTGAVRSVVFSPDGTKVLTGSNDRTARLWETESGQLPVTLISHTDMVTSVAFSPDGTKVLTGSIDQTVQLWEAKSGNQLAMLKGHTGGIRSVAFSPDGTKVLTGSDDRTARLWETASEKRSTTLEAHSDRVRSVVFSPDGTKALTSSDDGTARLWETASGNLLSVLKGDTGMIWSVAFSPDGTKVLTGSDDGIARIWETANGSLLATLEGYTAGLRSAMFSPDGMKMLTGLDDQTVQLWDIVNRKLLMILKSNVGGVKSIAFSPDGAQVFTVSDDGAVQIWDTTSGTLLATLQDHSGRVSSIEFSLDGLKLLTGSDDGTVNLWETTSRNMLAGLKGHTGWVTSIAFSPDSRLMLSCDQHGQALLRYAIGARTGSLLGVYIATYEIGAIHWQDMHNALLADMGGPRFRPHFYRLKLEGIDKGEL